MSRPIVVTVSGRNGGPAGDGCSTLVPVDRMLSPFSLAIGVKVEGSAIYQVEHTYDDVYSVDFRPANAQWHLCPTAALNRSSHSGFGGYLAPPTAVRVRVIAGNGLVTMTVVHGGMALEQVTRQPRQAPPQTDPAPAPAAPKLSLWGRFKQWLLGGT